MRERLVASARRPSLTQHDLYRSLRSIVSRTASERKIAIADSKELYKPGLGLRQLERGVHAVLLAMRQSLDCWSTLIDGVVGRSGRASSTALLARRIRLCVAGRCGGGGTRSVRRADCARLRGGGRAAAGDSGTAGVSGGVQRAVRALRHQRGGAVACDDRVVARSDGSGSTHAVLSTAVTRLARLRRLRQARRPELLHGAVAAPFSRALDRAGAREPRREPLRMGPATTRGCEVAFRMNGEEFLPTALASMTAKYLRELAMRAFNEFWCASVPGLRPTAGYPDGLHRGSSARSTRCSASWELRTTCCGGIGDSGMMLGRLSETASDCSMPTDCCLPCPPYPESCSLLTCSSTSHDMPGPVSAAIRAGRMIRCAR